MRLIVRFSIELYDVLLVERGKELQLIVCSEAQRQTAKLGQIGVDFPKVDSAKYEEEGVKVREDEMNVEGVVWDFIGQYHDIQYLELRCVLANNLERVVIEAPTSEV